MYSWANVSAPKASATGIVAMSDGAPEVGDDHRLAPPPPAIDPGAGVQGEEEARDQRCRSQVAHLGRVRMKRENADEWQCDQRDLIP